MTTPSGPPVRLLTHAERVRRRRAVGALIAGVSLFAILLTVLALRVATRPNSDVHLGSTTFKVGNAVKMRQRIQADDYPLLFQDLQNNSIDIYVAHDESQTDPLRGWVAIEAHAPDRARTCQLKWVDDGYQDPCDGTRYPATGEGLRRFRVNVVDGVLYVNFRDVIDP
jgi:hypothetical protein